MSLPYFRKKPSALVYERLRKAWDDAYRHATALLARRNINLLFKDITTQKQVDAELKSIAEELAKLDY